jgi:hypothetical protein
LGKMMLGNPKMKGNNVGVFLRIKDCKFKKWRT